jgi:hypothetical protein
MATATLILLTIGAGYGAITAFGEDKSGGIRVASAIGAFWHGGCAWWLFFNSGLFG